MFWVICYIFSYYEGDDYTQQVMKDFADYIKQEMLSHQLVSGVPEHGVYAESFKLSGHALRLGVKKRLLKA